MRSNHAHKTDNAGKRNRNTGHQSAEQKGDSANLFVINAQTNGGFPAGGHDIQVPCVTGHKYRANHSSDGHQQNLRPGNCRHAAHLPENQIRKLILIGYILHEGNQTGKQMTHGHTGQEQCRCGILGDFANALDHEHGNGRKGKSKYRGEIIAQIQEL